MKQLTNKRLLRRGAAWRLVLSVAVFLIMISLIFFCAMQINKITDELVLAKADVAVFEAEAGEIKNFEANYQSYGPNFDRIDQAFVDPQNPLDFIEFLEAKAKEADIALKISPLSVSKGQNPKVVSAQLTAQGDFRSIMAFLEKAEGGRFLLSMQNLIMKKTKNATEINISISALAK